MKYKVADNNKKKCVHLDNEQIADELYSGFGLYIHIPFCRSRCVYCGFYSTTLLSLRGAYIDALCHEMELRREYVTKKITTIYLGGGTPSQLGIDDLKKLFQCIYKVYDVDKSAEVTIECNPDDITDDFACAIQHLPVNRVSMGVQTFSDARLKLLHRRHTAKDVYTAVKKLRKADISNISIDLIFGFPDEDIEQLHFDLNHALDCDVEHISTYSLTYEEGTTLWKMLQQGQIKEIDENLSADMYEEMINILTSSGYEHYEISNFARNGYRSRHNSSYWHQIPYIGIGAAAHSFNIHSRQWNIANVKKYINNIMKGEVPMEKEELSSDTRYNDIIATALRTKEGINLNRLEALLGSDYRSQLLRSSQKHIEGGYMKETDDVHITLTRKGLFISDMIMADLIII